MATAGLGPRRHQSGGLVGVRSCRIECAARRRAAAAAGRRGQPGADRGAVQALAAHTRPAAVSLGRDVGDDNNARQARRARGGAHSGTRVHRAPSFTVSHRQVDIGLSNEAPLGPSVARGGAGQCEGVVTGSASVAHRRRGRRVGERCAGTLGCRRSPRRRVANGAVVRSGARGQCISENADDVLFANDLKPDLWDRG